MVCLFWFRGLNGIWGLLRKPEGFSSSGKCHFHLNFDGRILLIQIRGSDKQPFKYISPEWCYIRSKPFDKWAYRGFSFSFCAFRVLPVAWGIDKKAGVFYINGKNVIFSRLMMRNTFLISIPVLGKATALPVIPEQHHNKLIIKTELPEGRHKTYEFRDSSGIWVYTRGSLFTVELWVQHQWLPRWYFIYREGAN